VRRHGVALPSFAQAHARLPKLLTAWTGAVLHNHRYAKQEHRMTDGTATAGVAGLVDLERYPIGDLATPEAQAIVARGRASLDATGICMMPGFLREGVAARLAAEAGALVHAAHRQDHEDIPYGRYRERQGAFPEGHPARRRSRFRMGLVTYDELPDSGGIKRLYHWDGLTRLIGALTGNARLYRTADALLSCNVSVLGPGDTHGWHVDGNEFSVTLLLQEPEAGGQFEYAPVASPVDENFGAVAAVLDGDQRDIVAPPLRAGMLSVFRGRWSIHHVTPVEGMRTRLQVIFSYHVEPGLVFPEATRRNYAGRAA